MCISSDDFYDKVHPYERIISHQIYDDFLVYHLKGILLKTLSMGSRIVSTIIKSRIVSIIANWIDRNDSNIFSFNNKYKFNLIYKKSRDGSDCMTFHNKCNGIGPFVVLIKVQSKMIYGGYNPIGYNGRHQWLSSSESFIFSFENDQDILNMKIGRVINVNIAIYENFNCFFLNFGGHFIFTNQVKIFVLLIMEVMRIYLILI